MAMRSARTRDREVRIRPAERAAPSFVELSRPATGRELVLEIEGARGLRVRLTLRDAGRFAFGGFEGEGRRA